ncbi:MAG: hypothetical protein ACREX9_08800 [Gammaproteobacteria bacterium]
MPTPETARAALAVIDIAAEEHPKLRYGIGEPPQWLAWAPARRNDNGWLQLLVSARIAPTEFLPIRQVSVEVEGEPPTLEAYFRAVAERIAETIQTQLTPLSSREPYVILNLAPVPGRYTTGQDRPRAFSVGIHQSLSNKSPLDFRPAKRRLAPQVGRLQKGSQRRAIAVRGISRGSARLRLNVPTR